MSLHRYFKISSKLPDPNGPLSKEVPSEAIKKQTKASKGPLKILARVNVAVENEAEELT